MAIKTENFQNSWSTAELINERIKHLEEVEKAKIITVAFTSPTHAYIVYQV